MTSLKQEEDEIKPKLHKEKIKVKTPAITYQIPHRHEYFGCYAKETDKENAAPSSQSPQCQLSETEVERARRHILRLQI